MRILVIDGQGGNIGRQLVKMISEAFPAAQIHAVGTNSVATSNMMKGGDITAATGENAVIVGCRKADVIVGPLGIVVADSLEGEVTPKMSVAVAQSNAVRILVPMNKCNNVVAGVHETSASALLSDVIKKIGVIAEKFS